MAFLSEQVLCWLPRRIKRYASVSKAKYKCYSTKIMLKLSVVIPCYNEERTIDEIVSRVESAALPPGWGMEIIIVDDCSTDKTRGKIAKYSGRHKTIFRDSNGGKGAALKTGFSKTEGDFILLQDADLEYSPDDYKKLLSALDEKHQIVFGSRNIGHNNVPFSAVYFYGGLLIGKIFNVSFGTHLSDITTCYKLFPRSLVQSLMYLPSDDFVFDAVDLTYALSQAGAIAEVPITYTARTKRDGKKLNWTHGVKCLMAILRIKFGTDGFIRRLRHGKVLKFVRDGSTVLDVGCGPDFVFLNFIRGRIQFGYGLDKKTNNFRSDKLHIFQNTFDTQESTRFPKEVRDIDQVFILAVLEHLHFPEQTLLKSYNCLRDGGEIIITTPSVAAKPVLEFLAFKMRIIDEEEIRDHKRYFSKDELVNAVRAAGFREVEHRFFEFGMNQVVTAVK
jgi:dolichol-phosphate mannosyltransferase